MYWHGIIWKVTIEKTPRGFIWEAKGRSIFFGKPMPTEKEAKEDWKRFAELNDFEYEYN